MITMILLIIIIYIIPGILILNKRDWYQYDPLFIRRLYYITEDLFITPFNYLITLLINIYKFFKK